jgi:hypothetical protein
MIQAKQLLRRPLLRLGSVRGMAEVGHSVTEDQWRCHSEWEKRGKVRDSPDAVWRARIIGNMAGAEAELVLLGSTQGGDGNDRYQIELMAEELERGKDWKKDEASCAP